MRKFLGGSCLRSLRSFGSANFPTALPGCMWEGSAYLHKDSTKLLAASLTETSAHVSVKLWYAMSTCWISACFVHCESKKDRAARMGYHTTEHIDTTTDLLGCRPDFQVDGNSMALPELLVPALPARLCCCALAVRVLILCVCDVCGGGDSVGGEMRSFLLLLLLFLLPEFLVLLGRSRGRGEGEIVVL